MVVAGTMTLVGASSKRHAAHQRMMLFASFAMPALSRSMAVYFMASIVMTTPALIVFPVALPTQDLVTIRRRHSAMRWKLGLYLLMIALIFVLPVLPPSQALTFWVIGA